MKIIDNRVILLGDTHLGARSDALFLHRRFEKFYNYLFSYMKKHKLKTIIQFGDLFDRRKYINFQTLKLAQQYFFDKLAEHGFTMYVIVGNHDTHLKNSLEGNAPRLLLEEYENIIVIDEPTTVNIGHTSALMVPWICLENNDVCMKAIEESEATLCFGHFELSGFEMYKNSFCNHGLSPDLFWKFEHVYTGHFHHISTKDNITYLGSPNQITWSDFGDERGFFILDTKTLKTEFVKNPFENFYKLNFDGRKLKLEDLDKIDYSQYKDTFVKVIIINRNNTYLLDKFIENLEENDAIVQTVEDHKYKNTVTDETIIKNVDDISDTFRKISKQYADSVDPKKLHQFLLDLYTEANSLSA